MISPTAPWLGSPIALRLPMGNPEVLEGLDFEVHPGVFSHGKGTLNLVATPVPSKAARNHSVVLIKIDL